jgi:hypothetical protein
MVLLDASVVIKTGWRATPPMLSDLANAFVAR